MASGADFAGRTEAVDTLQGKILEAITSGIDVFIHHPVDDRVLSGFLARLGEATGADRVYMFRNEVDARGTLRGRQLLEWVAEGITPQIDRPELQGIDYVEAGFGRWVEVLQRGELIAGPVNTFPESERPILEAQDIKALVVAPIRVDDRWWGVVGFDFCKTCDFGLKAHTDALRLAAGLLGSAIGRKQVHTERKQTEEALRASEARYRSLFENAREAVIVSGPDGCISAVNPAAVMLLGCSDSAELIGTFGDELYQHPEERTELFGILQEKGYVEAYETTLLRQDGSGEQVHVLGSAIIHRDDDGEVLRVEKILTNITERRLAEEALMASEERYRTISALISDFAFSARFTSDFDVEMDWVTPSVERILGYPLGKIPQKSLRTIVHPDDLERLMDRLLHLARGEIGEAIEIRVFNAQGNIRWLRAQAEVIAVEDKHSVHLIGAARDITAQKIAEEELRQSEERWRKLVEYHPEPIMILSGYHILYINEAGARLYGVEAREELYGRSVLEFAPDDDYPILAERAEMLARGKRNEPREFRLLGADGETRHVEAFSVPIMYAGQQAAQVVLRDISERKRYEGHLIEAREQAEEARQRAEEMNRLKTSFLANMSHEVRTPLTAMIGFADLLAEEVSEEHQVFVELIQTSGRRLLGTLNSVLDLAQLEGRTRSLNPRPVDVAEEARQVLQLFQPQVQMRGLDVEVQQVGSPVWASLDQGAFSRVLLNLIENSIKFTEEGHVRVNVFADEAQAVVQVEDTGIGISPEFLPNIFNEFEQESKGLSRSHEGTGLGLTITKRLVELMGGTITVQSEKGKGTRFTVQFPSTVRPLSG